MNCDEKKRVIENGKKYVALLFENEASGHDRFHTFRVMRTASKLARTEGADEFVSVLAALLHDVDDRKLFPDSEGLPNASSFLEREKVDSETARAVLAVIPEISFKGTGSVIPSTPEGRCVQDADRLDALGAIGIARTFAFGGSRGRAMYDPDVPPVMNMNAEQYRTARSTSVNHFYEKLFLLGEMMNTESGRREAERREAFMRSFLDEFFSEWND